VTLVDTFTPSFAPVVSVAPTGSGTIIAYSEWSSIYGSKQTGSSAGSSLRMTGSTPGAMLGAAAATTLGLMFGAILAMQ
jgi:hypothetical protein